MSLDETVCSEPAPERRDFEIATGAKLSRLAIEHFGLTRRGNRDWWEESDSDFRGRVLQAFDQEHGRAQLPEPTPPTQPSKGAAELRAQGLTATGQAPGRKDDAEKMRMDLLPWRALESIAAVLTYGAQRYGDDNWHRVLEPNRRYFAAALRHLGAWRLGQKNDPDTGLPHLAHAACCVLFLLSLLVGFDPPLDD